MTKKQIRKTVREELNIILNERNIEIENSVGEKAANYLMFYLDNDPDRIFSQSKLKPEVISKKMIKNGYKVELGIRYKDNMQKQDAKDIVHYLINYVVGKEDRGFHAVKKIDYEIDDNDRNMITIWFYFVER